MTMGLLSLSSCSENDDTPNEYENWQQRNDAFFASLEDSLAANPAVWAKFKSYSKDQSLTTGKNTDCIYVKKLKSDATGSATPGCPNSTDSVMVTYIGRLIPSTSYPKGYIFDTRSYDDFDEATNAYAKFVASSTVDGFSTALYHMQRRDYWRVYIPYTLGYGTTDNSSIPGYSTLIFDLMLIDFTSAGNPMPVWNARQK